jgi:hypothetical protein
LLQRGLGQHQGIVMGVRVDETRRQHQALTGHHLPGGGAMAGIRGVQDGGDHTRLHDHVGGSRWRATGVDQAGGAQEQVCIRAT